MVSPLRCLTHLHRFLFQLLRTKTYLVIVSFHFQRNYLYLRKEVLVSWRLKLHEHQFDETVMISAWRLCDIMTVVCLLVVAPTLKLFNSFFTPAEHLHLVFCHTQQPCISHFCWKSKEWNTHLVALTCKFMYPLAKGTADNLPVCIWSMEDDFTTTKAGQDNLLMQFVHTLCLLADGLMHM